MKTRFLKLAVLMLALMLALTGCSLIEVDQEKDMAQVAATVNGVEITKGEVIDQYTYFVDYYTYVYSYYGMELDADTISALKDSVLNMFVERELISQKAVELGLVDLNDDAAFVDADAKAAEYFEELVTEHASHVDTTGLTEEAARTTIIEHMEADGITLDAVIADYRSQHVITLINEYVTADVAVTEEEIQTAYEAQVLSDTETYSESTYSYEQAMLSGEAVAWNPEGYRTVKHILFLTTDEQDAELSSLETQLTNVEAQIAAMSVEVEGADDVAPVKTLDELNAEKASLEQQLADKKAEIVASFSEKTQGVYDRLSAGESFDALMAELGEDPGMQSEPNMTTGYYVSAASVTWDTNFRDAAMALETVGDVSEPVLSSSGIHIIYYNSDVPAGAVALDSLRDSLEAELLETKKTEIYNAQYDEWLAGAQVKKYPKVLP